MFKNNTKDRKNIGQVELPLEKMMNARELSSCCVSTEAYLESNSQPGGKLAGQLVQGLKNYRPLMNARA